MRERIDFTVGLVKEAGANIKELMADSVKIETKSADNDFVTNVDKATEVILVQGLKKKYPLDDFLTEEKTVATAGLDDLWIIDPIDGTTNFIFQKENFAISIAYYYKEKPVFGIVYDVMRDELFLGITGEGAYLNDVRMPQLEQSENLKDAIVYGDLYSLSMFEMPVQELNKQFVAHRYLGAASIEICGVAANRMQAYISKNLKVWDVAAGAIILSEVGGHFSFGDIEDGIFFNDNDGEFFSASNQGILNDFYKLKG